MQNPESNTAAERPSLLIVKNLRYVGSIKHHEHSFEVAEVQAHVLNGVKTVEVSIGGSSRDLSIDEARALGAALLQAVEALA